MRVLSSVEGCGGARLFALSDEAALTLDALSEDDQRAIMDGFVRFYRKTMRLLVGMKMNPFSSLDMNLKLIPLAQETVVVDVGEYVLFCGIDLADDVLHVTIQRIKTRGSLMLYRSQAL